MSGISPLIIRWLELPDMKDCLDIMDMKVKKLVDAGAKEKLKDWFFTGDINFFTNTAETYIIDYLQTKNKVCRNIKKRGIDAYAEINGKKIGIEITTLNGFIADTIFAERLTWKLEYSGYLEDKSLTMICDACKIAHEYHTIGRYIDKIYQMIISKNNNELYNNGIQLEIDSKNIGTIARRWNNKDYPWFDEITTKLKNKLKNSQKAKQFEKYAKNIVFVGVNNCSPVNCAIPHIFSEMKTGGQFYKHEIQNIETFWTNELKKTQIAGICYYVYSLERETPFYPLKIFWRDNNDAINIIL